MFKDKRIEINSSIVFKNILNISYVSNPIYIYIYNRYIMYISIIDICENTYIPGKIRNDKYSK